MMIYYNTRVFEEAGISRPSNDWTWEDFLEIAKKLTSGSGPQSALDSESRILTSV
jgi:multiple sugar transport system substrate-binding protein